MVSAYFGQGVELQMSDMEVAPTFTTIPGAGTITGPGATRDMVDVTTHSSTGGYREYIGGLRDGGELSFDMNVLFGDATQLDLISHFDTDVPVDFRLVYPMSPDEEYDEFQAFVQDHSSTSPIDAQLTKSVTLKITGPVERVTPP